MPEILLDRLQMAMDSAGVKQADLARAAEISRGYMSQIMSGARANISIDPLTRIAERLQVSTDWLRGRSDLPNVQKAIEAEREFVTGEQVAGYDFKDDEGRQLARRIAMWIQQFPDLPKARRNILVEQITENVRRYAEWCEAAADDETADKDG